MVNTPFTWRNNSRLLIGNFYLLFWRQAIHFVRGPFAAPPIRALASIPAINFRQEEATLKEQKRRENKEAETRKQHKITFPILVSTNYTSEFKEKVVQKLEKTTSEGNETPGERGTTSNETTKENARRGTKRIEEMWKRRC